jgi:pilus assembly protein CpaB
MNSTFLRILAAFMVITAIVTAWLGYRVINKKPMNKLAVVVPSYSQVVAREDIPVGHVLTAADLEIATTQQYDKRTFSDTQNLIGKVTTMAMIKGAPFKTSQFPNHSALTQALAYHERAVAIKVNEVIGVGGFIKPGDYVDVLLYLRADRENGEVSSAQIVLSNVKVLAYGALITETESNLESERVQSASNKLGTTSSRSGTKKEKDSRSAILAVTDQDVSKLMLADSTGVLRLALRGGSLPSSTSNIVSDNQFIRLGDVSQPTNKPLSKTTVKPSSVSVKKESTTSSSQHERVVVLRGEQVEVVKVAR